MANPSIGKQSSKKASKASVGSVGHLFGQSTRKSNLDADWLELDAQVLLRLVWAVDFFGGAVTLSTTKNGAAYVVKVFMGAPFDPMYFDGDEEGRASMAAWVESLVVAAAESG
jgi:hypothetical protein